MAQRPLWPRSWRRRTPKVICMISPMREKAAATGGTKEKTTEMMPTVTSRSSQRTKKVLREILPFVDRYISCQFSVFGMFSLMKVFFFFFRGDFSFTFYHGFAAMVTILRRFFYHFVTIWTFHGHSLLFLLGKNAPLRKIITQIVVFLLAFSPFSML